MLVGSLLGIVFVGASDLSAAEPKRAQDLLMITEVSPELLTSGEEVDVVVKVAYELSSYESGAIRLSANILAPNGDRKIASASIKKGAGEVTLRARIVPRYWSDVVPFGVNAALVVPVGDALLTKALSLDRANFRIQKAVEKKAASTFPSVATTYVDGVSIIQVSPESFSDGVKQEIVVRVKYELLSREEGEISLAASYGTLAARRTIGSTRVKIGKGEAEVRAIITPLKTGTLPLGRLLIALFEVPRGKAAIPLAWDEATISVK